MKKTASEITADFYKFIKESDLAKAVNGGVYLDGLRPANSQKEDIIIAFMTGLFDVFDQTGKVVVNIYVPDKDSSGIKKKNFQRCREIERACQNFIDTFNSNKYRLMLGNIIQTFAEEDINQHFVNLQIEFRHNTLV